MAFFINILDFIMLFLEYGNNLSFFYDMRLFSLLLRLNRMKKRLETELLVNFMN